MRERKLQRFLVELAAIDWHEFPHGPCLGKKWRARFIPPTRKFAPIVEVHGESSYRAKQLVVEAENEKTAQRALNLIIGAFNIATAAHFFPTLGIGSPRLYLEDRSKRGSFEFDDGPPGLASTSGIPLACMIAARASLRLPLIYALAKLSLSIETYSVPPLELDPRYRGGNIPKSVFPEDHARMAFAIATAYSCIEELQLEVRANSNNPSHVNGKWNLSVRTDLERRLRGAGINLGERFHWAIRGDRTKIEMMKPPVIAQPAPWSAWRVRDGEMELVDAVSLSSFLRSKISTHRADKRLLRVLSVYDVANVQFLARRLLLETLGFWKYKKPRVGQAGKTRRLGNPMRREQLP